MRIVMVSRYFWPEVVLVNDISRWLVEAGFEVEVLTGQPDYNPEVGYGQAPKFELFDGVEIRRFSPNRAGSRGWRRNVGSLLFVIHAAGRVLFGPKCDIVWSSSIPPIIQPALLLLVTKIRGGRFLYYPQDIYPEIACATGMLRDNWLSRLLRRIDNVTLSNSDAVVTLSSDMVDVIRARGAKPKDMRVIRSFCADKVSSRNQSRKHKAPFEFVYAGNIGRFQNLDALVQVFERIDSKVACLTLLGDGREKARLQKLVEEKGIDSVRFHDNLPPDEAAEFVARCDVGVVALLPSIYRYAFPAKFYTYLGVGVPILALIEVESELARLVKERRIGTCVAWDAGEQAIDKGVHHIISAYEEYRENVLTNTDDLYRCQTARSRWVDLFKDLSVR